MREQTAIAVAPMDTNENVLVPLPGILLPPDLPWRVQFVALVEEHLRRMAAVPDFSPPRFFGYYFRGREPVAVAGPWTVLLDPLPPLVNLPDTLDRVTGGRFGVSAERDGEPEFILVHDRRDGACWLWRFAYGLRFVMAHEPVLDVDEAA